MSKISLLSVLTVGLSILQHPNFGAAVDLLDHAKTEIEAVTPDLEVGSTLVTAFAPGAGDLVAQVLADTGLLDKLVAGVAQVLKTQTPSTPIQSGSGDDQQQQS